MTDRAAFLRRAGAGAAGISLAQLLGPAGALAGDGGGDFAAHPRWRFVFVSHGTLDPLLVATQFGAQDAASLVRCSVQWTGSPRGDLEETVVAFRSAISRKADGIAVSLLDRRSFAPELAAAARAKIPVVAFNVDTGPGRFPYVGEKPRASGTRVGAEIARLVRGADVLLLVPERSSSVTAARLAGVQGAMRAAAQKPSVTIVRLAAGPLRDQQAAVEAALAKRPGVRGVVALDGAGTLAAGSAIKQLGLREKGVHGGGYDLLPGDLELVAEGHLDFVVDQQPYLQGFTPVLQLFLARISEGTVVPWDTETSVLLRRDDVAAFLATKSRFEGSSSRHEFPLRRA